MSEFINTADVIGDDEMCNQLIMRTVTEYKENRVAQIGMSAFYSCNALTVVDVPNVTTIASQAFGECSALESLILRSSVIAILESSDSLKNSGIAKGTGFAYVPRDLVGSYQLATNWSTYANQIRAIEDYTVDGTTTGELDESKL